MGGGLVSGPNHQAHPARTPERFDCPGLTPLIWPSCGAMRARRTAAADSGTLTARPAFSRVVAVQPHDGLQAATAGARVASTASSCEIELSASEGGRLPSVLRRPSAFCGSDVRLFRVVVAGVVIRLQLAGCWVIELVLGGHPSRRVRFARWGGPTLASPGGVLLADVCSGEAGSHRRGNAGFGVSAPSRGATRCLSEGGFRLTRINVRLRRGGIPCASKIRNRFTRRGQLRDRAGVICALNMARNLAGPALLVVGGRASS